jgi:hypothetical protein
MRLLIGLPSPAALGATPRFLHIAPNGGLHAFPAGLPRAQKARQGGYLARQVVTFSGMHPG